MGPPPVVRNAVTAKTNLPSNCEPDNRAAARCNRWIWPKFSIRFCEAAAADQPGLCTGSAPAASQGGGANSGTFEILLVQQVWTSFCCVRRRCCHLFGVENVLLLLVMTCCDFAVGEFSRISSAVNGTNLRRRQLRLFQQLAERLRWTNSATCGGGICAFFKGSRSKSRWTCPANCGEESAPAPTLYGTTSAGRTQRLRRGGCANRSPTAHGAIPAGGAQQVRRFLVAERKLRRESSNAHGAVPAGRAPATARRMRLDVLGHSNANFYQMFPVPTETTFLQ